MAVNKIFIRILSGILGVVFIGVIVIGSIALFKIPYYSNLGVALVVFGVFGLGVSISGCCGAGFEKENIEKKKEKVFFYSDFINFRSKDFF
jgi:hypothetical protein